MKSFFYTVILLIMPITSHAMIELRGGYSMYTFDDRYTGLDLEKASAINADLIVQAPFLLDGLGLGLRYETLSFDFELNGVKVSEAKLNRIAALANYRMIDSTFFLGAIGTMGFKNDFKTESSGVTDEDYNEKLNFSVGLEGGINMGFLSLGAEVGKLFAIVENPGSPDMSLNSTYVKVLVGLHFLKTSSVGSTRGARPYRSRGTRG
ncbi:hypothetical protein K2X05_00065 [bacterium]|nr:hypothetical protein [bacterium]